MPLKYAILEDVPCPQLEGWRHYHLVTADKPETASFVSRPAEVMRMVYALRGAFYQAGYWEDYRDSDSTQEQTKHIKPHILEELAGGNSQEQQPDLIPHAEKCASNRGALCNCQIH